MNGQEYDLGHRLAIRYPHADISNAPKSHTKSLMKGIPTNMKRKSNNGIPKKRLILCMPLKIMTMKMIKPKKGNF